LAQKGNVIQPITDARVTWCNRGFDQLFAERADITGTDDANFKIN